MATTPIPAWRLNASMFATGFCTMSLEIVATRVLAPYYGTSVFVWTSLIGIVLAAITAGYAWGGRASEHNQSLPRLSRLILAAGAWIALMPLINDPFLAVLQGYIKDIRVGSLIASLVLCGIPAFLLAASLPIAVGIQARQASREAG